MEFILAAANASLRREEISMPRAVQFFCFSFSLPVSLPILSGHTFLPLSLRLAHATNQPNRISHFVCRRKTMLNRSFDKSETRRSGKVEIREEERIFSFSFSAPSDATYRDVVSPMGEGGVVHEGRRKEERSSVSADAFRKPLNRHQPYPIAQRPSTPPLCPSFSLFPLRFPSRRQEKSRARSARVVEYLFKPRFEPPPARAGGWK